MVSSTIELIIINIDDVLYNNEMTLDTNGNTHRGVFRNDLRAISNLADKKKIIIVGISSESVDYFVKNIFNEIYQNVIDVTIALKEILSKYKFESDKVAYLGKKNIDRIANCFDFLIYCPSNDPQQINSDRITYLFLSNNENFISKLFLGFEEMSVKKSRHSDFICSLEDVKNICKTLLKKHYFVHELFMHLLNYKDKEYNYWKKRRIRGGNGNPDKFFYIMRDENTNEGPVSTLIFYFSQIYYYSKKGIIPIIDLKNYYLPMWQDFIEKGKKNAYDNYFIPQYDLEEVYNSKNVILGWQEAHSPGRISWDTNLYRNKEMMNEYCNIAHNFFRFNDAMTEYIESVYKRIFPIDGKVLGVECRRSFEYTKLANDSIIDGHPIQFSVEKMIDEIKKNFFEWKCQYVYIVCEDREYVDRLKEAFPNIAICMDRKRKHYFINGFPVFNVTEVEKEFLGNNCDTVFQRNREYFTDIALLSKCNCLISSVSSASFLARFLNGNTYEHEKLIDNGYY